MGVFWMFWVHLYIVPRSSSLIMIKKVTIILFQVRPLLSSAILSSWGCIWKLNVINDRNVCTTDQAKADKKEMSMDVPSNVFSMPVTRETI